MIEAFNALMRRQPEEYRLDHVAHLTHEQLGKRLHKFIVLTHRGALTPERGVCGIQSWRGDLAYTDPRRSRPSSTIDLVAQSDSGILPKILPRQSNHISDGPYGDRAT